MSRMNNMRCNLHHHDNESTTKISANSKYLDLIILSLHVKILLFYLIFFSAITSSIGAEIDINQPSLKIFPMPANESTLIWYNATLQETYIFWINRLNKFLEVYDRKPTDSERRIYCDYNKLPPQGKVCDVNLNIFNPCIKQNNYNYHKSAPCVFLKLSEKPGWIPRTYEDSENLPINMPAELKLYTLYNPRALNTVWVTCEGETPADMENMGSILYIPKRGFPGFYFPHNNTEDYLSPLVAVYFQNPQKGVLINIECKIWAKNIKYNRAKKLGFAHFELMVD